MICLQRSSWLGALVCALISGCGADGNVADGGPESASASCAPVNVVNGASATYRFRFQGAATAQLVSVAVTEETASHFKLAVLEDNKNATEYLFAKTCFDTVFNGQGPPSRWSAAPPSAVAAVVYGGGIWDPATLFALPVAPEPVVPANPLLDSPSADVCSDNQVATVPAGTFVVLRCRSPVTEKTSGATILSVEQDLLSAIGAARPFGGLIRQEIRYADAAPSTVELVSWNGL